MALHTYTPTSWKDAPGHKTTPVNATNLNNIEDGIVNAYTDISSVDTKANTKAAKTNLTNISASGSTNNSGGKIDSGKYFYLNGSLVRAITDIANGATFTENTNYEVVTAGALNELQSKKIGFMGTNAGSYNNLMGGQTYTATENCWFTCIGNTNIDVVINGIAVAGVNNSRQTVPLRKGDVVSTNASSGAYAITYRTINMIY